MASDPSPTGLSFNQACKYLGLAPEELTELRTRKLVAYTNDGGRQTYPQIALDLTHDLLKIGRVHNWGHATLAWYADLVFATEVGRAILLPIADVKTPLFSLPISWLETPYVSAVLQDLEAMLKETEGPLITLLCSLTAAALGDSQFWPNQESLKLSGIRPIITHFEAIGAPIIDQSASVARDAGPIFVSAIHAFTSIAPPISPELAQLIVLAETRIRGQALLGTVSAQDQKTIHKEALIAVDKVYASKATEIHTLPEVWDFKTGVIRAEKRTIALQMKLPLESDQEFIDNIIDLIRPYVGAYGARVVHLMYEIANDAPYWRNPLITVDTNEILDRLGLKRDSRGVHRSGNRERLRDMLNAAHNLEIVGEYTAWEDGQPMRKAFRKTVLSLVGATFDPGESQDLSTSELFQHGLPKTMQIKLNFYDGVRRPDGTLGNRYILVPRLAEPKQLPKANYSGTHELLRSYFLLRYRQTRMKSRALSVTRQTALEKANIETKNITWATRTLAKALKKLVVAGILESFGDIPLRGHEAFEVVLAETAVQREANQTE